MHRGLKTVEWILTGINHVSRMSIISKEGIWAIAIWKRSACSIHLASQNKKKWRLLTKGVISILISLSTMIPIKGLPWASKVTRISKTLQPCLGRQRTSSCKDPSFSQHFTSLIRIARSLLRASSRTLKIRIDRTFTRKRRISTKFPSSTQKLNSKHSNTKPRTRKHIEKI